MEAAETMNPTSWKTTTLGVMTILSAIAGATTKYLNGEPIDWEFVVTSFIAGLGLIKAKDYNATHSHIINSNKEI